MKDRTPVLVGCALIISVLGAFVFLSMLTVALRGGGDLTAWSSSERIGRVDLLGEITDSREILNELKRQEEDPSVRALVVRIDSPGGVVAPSQEIYAGLRRFSESTHRPIVVSMGSLAASGGYYVACAADRVVANPATLTGSIGVIMSFADASRLLEKIGVRFEVVKSGARKDAGAFWRGLDAEDRAALERTLHDVYLQFAEVVVERRGLDLGTVLELGDGRIFSGHEARGLGLVDSLGDLHTAICLAADMAGIRRDAPTVTKRRPASDWRVWFDRVDDRARVLLGCSPPVMEYRYR